MNKLSLFGAACVVTLASTPVLASPVSIDVSYTIQAIDFTSTSPDISGTFASTFSAGQVIHGTFVYDDDETVGSKEVDGSETSYYYTGVTGPYGVSINSTGGYNFSGNSYGAGLGNDVDITLAISTEETNGKLVPGTYDLFDVFGDSTVDLCSVVSTCSPGEFIPSDGQEWGMNIINSDTSWLSNDGLIPDDLMPTGYTALLIGKEYNAAGVIIGQAVLTIDFNVTSVPVPAAVWLFGSGLIGLIGVARRKI